VRANSNISMRGRTDKASYPNLSEDPLAVMSDSSPAQLEMGRGTNTDNGA
jgi:hypothetical protein